MVCEVQCAMRCRWLCEWVYEVGPGQQRQISETPLKQKCKTLVGCWFSAINVKTANERPGTWQTALHQQMENTKPPNLWLAGSVGSWLKTDTHTHSHTLTLTSARTWGMADLLWLAPAVEVESAKWRTELTWLPASLPVCPGCSQRFSGTNCQLFLSLFYS